MYKFLENQSPFVIVLYTSKNSGWSDKETVSKGISAKSEMEIIIVIKIIINLTCIALFLKNTIAL